MTHHVGGFCWTVESKIFGYSLLFFRWFTNLSEEKEIKIVSKCPTPSAQHGACPLGKEGLVPHMPPTQEAASFPPDDDCSSDLDLEQLMEDIGEPEERGEMQQRGSSEEFLAALFEE